MSYEDTLIREMTDETPPNHEDACPVCDKIECVCPPEPNPDARYYESPCCGIEVEIDREDKSVFCPGCHKLLDVDVDAEFVNGSWHDLTKLVERKQEPVRVRSPYEVRGSATSNACFGAL